MGHASVFVLFKEDCKQHRAKCLLFLVFNLIAHVGDVNWNFRIIKSIWKMCPLWKPKLKPKLVNVNLFIRALLKSDFLYFCTLWRGKIFSRQIESDWQFIALYSLVSLEFVFKNSRQVSNCQKRKLDRYLFWTLLLPE